MGAGHPDHKIGLLPPQIILLGLCTFAACVLTSATGATSLLTIPLMIQFGVEPRTAIATNMALLVLMNLGSSVGFYGEDSAAGRRVILLIVLTLAGSAVGAMIMLRVPPSALRLVVPCAMIGVLAFLLASSRHPAATDQPSRLKLKLGYGVSLLLAVYGGFFSGGYVTMAVTAFTFFFAYSFLQAIALARLLNLASSLAAVILFAIHGAINWQLGLVLGVIGFVGAFAGARVARRIPEKWLHRGFTATVAILAVKAVIDLWK